MNTPSPQLIGFTFGLLARLHAMVGDEQALVIIGGIDSALGHASQDGNEVSMHSAYDENTKALVLILAVSTPTANLTTTTGVIAHLHAVQALIQNNTLRN
jgi:hypothetical protein